MKTKRQYINERDAARAKAERYYAALEEVSSYLRETSRALGGAHAAAFEVLFEEDDDE